MLELNRILKGFNMKKETKLSLILVGIFLIIIIIELHLTEG